MSGRKQPTPPPEGVIKPRRTPPREERIPPKLEDLPDPLTIKELAALLRISRTTARGLVADGVIAAHRLGSGRRPIYLIRKADYLAWFNREK